MANKSESSAWKKAANTDRWTEILFKALSNRVATRWRFVSFRGSGGGEWKGIVDVLGIRKNSSQSDHHTLKAGDLFDIVLVQMKGGSAQCPSKADIGRLRAVARRYRVKDVILFTWKKGEGCVFHKLGPGTQWSKSSAAALFG